MSDIMNLAIKITAIELLSGVLNKTKAHLDSLGGEAKKVKKDFDAMACSVEKGLAAMSVGTYFKDKLTPGIKAASDMEEAMNLVKSNIVTSTTKAEEMALAMNQVKKSAQEISAQTTLSDVDVANIENALAKAGIRLNEITMKGGAAWAVAAMSTISKEPPELMAETSVNIASQFKLKGTQYKDMVDWLVKVDAASTTSVPMLAYGLQMAGSNAAALGIPLKDAITSLGALASLKERAGSSFNNFLIGVLQRTDMQKKAMKEVGLDFFDKGKFIGMERSIDMLKLKFGAIKDDEKRLTDLIKIFGEEGGRAANEFIQGAKSFKDLNEEANNSLDAQQKMNIMMDGLNNKTRQLGNTMKRTLEIAFEPLLPILNKAVASLNWIIEKAQTVQKTIPKTSGLLAGGAVAGILGTYLYGAGMLGKGAYKGGKVIKGIGGGGLLNAITGKGLNLAEAKAMEAVAGVQPVSVINWPASLAAGGLLNALDKNTGQTGEAIERTAEVGASKAGKILGVASKGFILAEVGIMSYELTKALDAATGNNLQHLGEWIGGKLFDLSGGYEGRQKFYEEKERYRSEREDKNARRVEDINNLFNGHMLDNMELSPIINIRFDKNNRTYVETKGGKPAKVNVNNGAFDFNGVLQ